jgi:amino acid transporter
VAKAPPRIYNGGMGEQPRRQPGPGAEPPAPGGLVRGIGLWQATALNVTMVVGAGVFLTVPLMLKELPGPYALLPWVAAGALILVDGLIWSELGAALPGSGGSYQYLLRSYGESRWGRLLAFLFIWQFLISGPLELGSGLAALAQFAPSLHPAFREFNKKNSWTWEWLEVTDPSGQKVTLGMTFDPAHLLAFLLGLGIVLLLYRNITTLGRLTVLIWAGVLVTIAWILVEGLARFDPAVAFDTSGDAAQVPDHLADRLGATMLLAIYSYLGYYNVCYLGDEVRDPGRTVPRAILLSTLLVLVLFVGVHLALLGTVPWQEVRGSAAPEQNLAATFMTRVHGDWAATLVTVLLIWCIVGSAFAGLLGYSRIPYGAARNGHFFAVFARVHPRHRIPHVALLLVGGLMLFWTFFELETIIKALVVTRILEQFIAQIVGVMLLRRHRPDLYRPYKIWLYPLPCLLALAGWLFVYCFSGWLYVGLGLLTLATGVVAFLLWSRHVGGWPFRKDEG